MQQSQAQLAFRSLAVGLTSAGIAGAAAWCVPDMPGVSLSDWEMARAAGVFAAVAGLCGAALAVALRGRWALTGGSLLPAAVLLLLAVLPTAGVVRVHTPRPGIWAVALLAGLAVATLRTRLAPVVVVLLLGAAGWSATRLGLSARVWSAGGSALGEGGEGPDVWLITLDTVRGDHFAFNGGAHPAPTPNLDALAARGRVFSQAFSPASLTGPVHAAVLSGQTPSSLGMAANGDPVPVSAAWLPAEMQAAGVYTEAWVSAGVLDAGLGFSRGFDRYDSTFEDRLTRGHALLRVLGWRSVAGTAFRRSGVATLARVRSRASVRGPRFRWVHLYDAHWPYTPSVEAARAVGLTDATPLDRALLPLLTGAPISEAERARGRALYKAGVADVDRQVGALLAMAGPDATIVVVGDHGESLGEHSVTFQHGGGAQAPQTWVPLIIAGPGVSAGREIRPVSLNQLADTLRGLVGLGAGPRDLLGEPGGEGVVVSTAWARDDGGVQPRSVAARDATHSLLWSPAAGETAHRRHADPTESAPVDPTHVSAPLRAAMDGALSSVTFGGATDASSAPPDLVEQLESLGYTER